MSAHTPGPWVAEFPTETRATFLINGNQDDVGAAVGEVYACIDLLFSKDDEQVECEANACLIAAAPDLLDAAHASIARCRNDCDHESYCGSCEPLVYAIAKAEGHP